MSGYVRQLAERAREASLRIGRLDGDARRRLVERMAQAISHRAAEIVLANAQDMERAVAAGLAPAMLDRLRLDEARGLQFKLLRLFEAMIYSADFPEGFRAALASAIQDLPERERLVMSLYYDDELNLKEIGAVLKVTESRVCQLHGQALVRLKARLAHWRDRGANG